MTTDSIFEEKSIHFSSSRNPIQIYCSMVNHNSMSAHHSIDSIVFFIPSLNAFLSTDDALPHLLTDAIHMLSLLSFVHDASMLNLPAACETKE